MIILIINNKSITFIWFLCYIVGVGHINNLVDNIIEKIEQFKRDIVNRELVSGLEAGLMLERIKDMLEEYKDLLCQEKN